MTSFVWFIAFSSLYLLPGLLAIPDNKLPLPTNYAIHAFDSGYIDRRSFDKYTEYHYIRPQQAEMVLTLPAGTENIKDEYGVRIEAFTPSKHWPLSSVENSGENWVSWKGSYRIDELGLEDRGMALFQMKSVNATIQWELQISINAQGDLMLNNRRRPDKVLLGRERVTDGRVFHIKVATNGLKYRVWYNGRFQAEEPFQMDQTGLEQYSWRWGIYKPGDTVAKKTTTLTMYRIAYGLSDSDGTLLEDVYEEKLLGSENVAKIVATCDDQFTAHVNTLRLGYDRNWKVASTYYAYFHDSNILEIEAVDTYGAGGFLADISFGSERIGTSSDWQVSLDRTNWVPATEYESYQDGIRVKHMPGDTTAKWIWSDDHRGDNKVYFRYTFDLGRCIIPTYT